MGKIVMPKNSALLNEIESVLQIYYEANDWLTNDIYKIRLKEMIGPGQYSSSYTKKAQITSYFGFTVWEDFNNPQSRRRITDSGRKIYEAIKADDNEKIQDVLMNALETVKFGRHNYGCPESDSDVEPPALFIRAILDLGYLTYREFAFLLWKLEDVGGNYTDALSDLRGLRNQGSLALSEEANKYADCKPIMILVRWGFLDEDDDSTGGKHIVINPEVLSRFESRLRNLKIYNIDMDYDEKIIDDDKFVAIDFDKVERVEGGSNNLLYGVPGAGKSWTIEHEYCNDETRMERLVFHPDYTYSDFVGQILPNVNDGMVNYMFTPGPFTTLLKKAYTNPNTEYFLVIEEINRGNAPAIFGDIFQLLDRKTVKQEIDDDGYPIGTSEYGITNTDIAVAVYGNPNHKVRITSNMSIIGSMNTSDQNVFTLDTAFQRRWEMRMIENSFDNADERFANHPILDSTVTWKTFCKAINNIILEKNVRMTSSEDKRLGVYFVHVSDLVYDENAENTELGEYERAKAKRNNSRFPEKVLKYLWDDAFKFSREDIFEVSQFNSLEAVVRKFAEEKNNDRFKVFKETVYDAFVSPNEDE